MLGFIAVLALIVISILPLVQSTPSALAAGTIAGVVFNDYNANGVMDTSASTSPTIAIDTGVAGVTVTAYDSAGVQRGTSTTASDGTYTLPAGGTGPYRVDFSTLPAGFQPSPHGTNNNTTVQFVPDGNSSNIDLGIFKPSDFCQNNPTLVISCIRPATAPAQASVESLAYSAGNTSTSLVTGPGGHDDSGLGATQHPIAVPASSVGSIYGLAYQISSKSIFASTFLKRNADLGTGGIGEIYRIDVSTGAATTSSPFYNFGALAGTDPRGGAAANAGATSDTAAYPLIGKVAFGDIDMIEDPANPANDALFIVNLNDRKLYKLPIVPGTPPTAPAGTAVGYQIPGTTAALPGAAQACATSDVRPFGLGVKDGLVYVGLVCSAQSTGLTSDLEAYIYTFDPGTATFSSSPFFEFALDHPRGCANGATSPTSSTAACGVGRGEWKPWDDNPPNVNSAVAVDAQPILTDIAFDGSEMILGFRDRFGDQNRQSRTAGEVLRVCQVAGVYTLESNGRCGGNGSAPQGTAQGPGNAEFYFADAYNTFHQEIAVGALVQVPGYPNVAATVFDPVFNGSNTTFDGGIRWLNNTSGDMTRSYRLYDGNNLDANNFGKENGLGDLIALCDAAPIEIGNRVWRDDNGNGVQDAGEPGLPNVTVKLYAPDGTTVLSTATTDAGGNYYFSSATGMSTASAKYGISGLTPNTSGYTVRLDNAPDYAAAGALGNLLLTTADTGPDHVDSDGALVGGFARTPVTTGVAGSTDHTYDFGFAPPVSVGNRVWWDVNNNGVQDGGEQPIPSVRLELFYDADHSGAIDPSEQTPIALTTSDASGLYLFTQYTDSSGNPLATPQLLRPGTYVVGIPPGEFAPGRPLAGTYSSGTTANAGGTLSELAPPDPDSVVSDTDDNGAKQPAGFYSGGVLSPPVSVTGGVEPTGETPDADSNPNGRPDANDNQTVDFGFYTLQLGSQVWRDANNSATIDAADGASPGIANVRVRLFAADGTTEIPVGPDGMLGTADDAPGGVLTDASGNYGFRSLAAGDYIVEVDTTSAALNTDYASSADIASSGNPNNNIDRDDNGTLVGATTVRSNPVTLTPGAAGNNVVTPASGTTYDPTVDFGFVPQKDSLGNFVWYDTDDDGIFDTGIEQPIPGVTVRLFADTNASGALDAGALQVGADQITDASGRYLFTGLDAGDYFVQIPPANFGGAGALVGYSNSGPSVAGDVNNNNHGTPVAGQGVISDKVTLTIGGEPTDDDDLDPTTNLTIDFGFYRLAVGNQLWSDVINNGVRDAGEPGLSGVRVELYDIDHILIAVTTTDGSGNYLFDQQTDAVGVGNGIAIEANDYYVKIPQSQFDPGGPLAGYHSSTGNGVTPPDPDDNLDNRDDGYPVAGDGVRTDFFTLTPGDLGAATNNVVSNAGGTTSNPTIDLAFYTMSLGNFVWQDANGNGVLDGGETPLGNVKVNLLDGGGALLDSTTTNAAGHYLFTGLVEGGYIVELDASNFAPVGPYPGFRSSTGTIGSATGAYEPAPDPDTNTADSRDNGTNQPGGAIRSGPITLVAGGEPTSAVETGGNTVSDPAPDTDSNLTVDFGLFAPVSLGNRVWIDANNNGAFDGGESNVPDGVVVNLYYDANGDGAIGGGETTAIRTTTASGGLYLFDNLAPGNYMVELDAGNFSGGGALVGFTSSTGAPGSASGPAEAAPDPDANPSDTDDNGTVSGALGAGGSIRSALVTLTPGGEPTGESPDNDPLTPDDGENLTVDFGVFQPARLGDQVWYDANHNGVQDGGETGAQNVTVSLYDAGNALVATTTTDVIGNYLFPDLTPGSYHVVFSNLPAGYVFTGQDQGGNDATDSDADPIGGQTGSYTLAAGGSDLTVDAGIYNDTRASLGDRVWYDTNENGVQDAGENGVPGVTVTLYTGAGVQVGAPTTTAADGSYLFSNLLEGDYYVQFTPPASYAFSPLDTGGNTPASDLTDSDADPATHRTATTHLDPGENDLTWDAGMYYTTVALGNRVWEDANNNGVYDAGEPGIPGLTITLYRDSNDDGTPDGAVIATATTDANGFYLFNGLTQDTYIVEVTPPAGYISTSGTNGAATGPYEGAATPDPDNNADADDNGTTSGGAVRSKPITLTRGGEPTGEATALPNPDTVTPDVNSNLALDFGFYRPLSLGSLVWHDANDNGIVDGGESGIGGVMVNLYDAGNSLVATTTTDASGNYLFTNLAPGDYTVEAMTPSGYVSSTDIASSADPNTNVDGDDNGVLVSPTTVRSAVVTLSNGAEPSDDPGQPAGNANRNNTVDFGFYQPLSLGNLVWADANNNGAVDGGESGVDGVTVNLYRDANGNGQIDAGEFLATQTTSGGGLYLFANLRPGDYIVELPGGNFAAGGALQHYASSTGGSSEPAADPDNDTNDDDNGTAQAGGIVTGKPVTLTSGGEPTTDGDANVNTNLSVDFGFYPLASLGDRVWLDTNKDGVQDAGENGVPGVTVQLYQPGADGQAGTGDDVLVATTTTGASGDYQFVDLVPGNYFVQFGLPTGYAHSPQDTTADTTDSDADTTTGRTPITTLTVGENDPTWDAGVYFTASLGDHVWLDQNANGVQDAGEPGIPGVTVTLYTSAGAQVGAPTTTDGSGNYAFPNLPPGDYYVQFTPPAGYTISPADQGTNDAADSDANVTGKTATTTIALGENDPTWDAGLYLPVSLGNLVWNDINNNGWVDGAESGLDGVVVNLYRDANGNGQIDAGEFVVTQTTSGGGRYLFGNLVPGSYLVQLDPSNFGGAGVLAGYHSSTGAISTNLSATGPYEPAAGPNNDVNDDDNGNTVSGQGVVSAPILLTSGGEPTNDGDSDANSNLSVDFGVFLPASLGSIVWYDTDKDGVLDSGETGVPGVTVTLYDGSGNPIATTTTDTSGGYQFGDLPPGSYSVGFGNLPTGYIFTQADQGANDGIDSDVDPTTGRTGLISVVPGQNDTTIFAGIVSSPTAITLASFTATREGNRIVVRWVTTAELNTWGFYLLRSPDGRRDHAGRVTTTPILGQGRGQGGASYSWIDTDAADAVAYTYWLEEIELNGTANEYGPAIATITQSSYSVYLPVAIR
jgi:hypothetical protein